MSDADKAMQDKSAPVGYAANLPPAYGYRTTFERMLLQYLALRPRRDKSGKRDGRRKAMVAALDDRATYIQIRNWRQGYRPAPQWAVKLLADKSKKHRDRFDDIIFTASQK